MSGGWIPGNASSIVTGVRGGAGRVDGWKSRGRAEPGGGRKTVEEAQLASDEGRGSNGAGMVGDSDAMRRVSKSTGMIAGAGLEVTVASRCRSVVRGLTRAWDRARTVPEPHRLAGTRHSHRECIITDCQPTEPQIRRQILLHPEVSRPPMLQNVCTKPKKLLQRELRVGNSWTLFSQANPSHRVLESGSSPLQLALAFAHGHFNNS